MRNEAVVIVPQNVIASHLKSREEPESRRFSGGTMWFCHVNRGSAASFHTGMTIFFKNRKRSHFNIDIRKLCLIATKN